MTRLLSGNRVLDYAAFEAGVARAAAGMAALGVGAGDAVAVMLRNDFPFLQMTRATARIGADIVPVNWHFSADEVAYILADSAAKLFVIHADLLPAQRSSIPPGLAVIVVPTPPEIAQAYCISAEATLPGPNDCEWPGWLAAQEPLPYSPAPLRAPLLYTSGTTGRPKAVRRIASDPARLEAFFGMIAKIYGLDDAIAGRSREPIVTVTTAPLYHGGPAGLALMSLLAGATMVLQPRFDEAGLLALIEEHRVTHAYMTPTMFVRLLRISPETRARYDLSSLRWVTHTAAPCPIDVKRAMIDWWGPLIYEYYGASETAPTGFISSEEWLAHPGSVGRPPAGVEVAILAEGGTRLGADEVGEIYVRIDGPDFTYHGDPAKREAIERDGMVTVGDVGYVDAEGYLFLCDRKTDMIISGGVNIYPAEIEAALLSLVDVEDAAVFGIPDEEYGERVAAFIQLRNGAARSPAALRDRLKPLLASYKIPRHIEFRDDLPRDDSGKIFKRKSERLSGRMQVDRYDRASWRTARARVCEHRAGAALRHAAVRSRSGGGPD